ncbi:Uncharacterised protein [Enterobacter cloacae]|nr:Uncharacterised protein [Enterobacter cloacae]
MVPEFGLTAETAQLDHRERKVEVVMLRFLHDGFIQLKGRHVLRGRGRDKPAVVADRYKYANFHHEPLLITSQVSRRFCKGSASFEKYFVIRELTGGC